MERCVLKNAIGIFLGDAEKGVAFIEQHGCTRPVRCRCRVLGVSRSGYHGWRLRPESARWATTVNSWRTYIGSMRSSWAVGCAPRACGRAGWRLLGQPWPRGTSDAAPWHPGAHEVPIAALHDREPSRRDGCVQPPEAGVLGLGANGIWLADITCLPTGEGWLYLAVVLDLSTRKVAGPPQPAGRGSGGHGSVVLLTADGPCAITCTPG